MQARHLLWVISMQTGRIGAPMNSDPTPRLQWIEVASFFQIPGFQIIGLPSPEVAEARERIHAAIEASDLELPRRKIVVNLSPASVRKRGTGADLAMALAVLASSEDGPLQKSFVAWGELGLDGQVKPAGQLTRTLHAAWEHADFVFISKAELDDGLRVRETILSSGKLQGKGPQIVGVSSLVEAWRVLTGRTPPTENPLQVEESAEIPELPNLMPISASLTRFLGVASAGKHHVLLLGPRGTGKSHALDWLTALQLPIHASERVSQALLHELSGSQTLIYKPTPIIRKISSQVRPSALIGSTSDGFTRPGEFALAHGGLLIADELPEWSRDSRELLREPLERGAVTLTRSKASIELPANFCLAANGNLCPCGGWPSHFPIPISPQEGVRRPPKCRCPESESSRYLRKLSGPILDRMDLVFLISYSRKKTASRRKANSPELRGFSELRLHCLETRERCERLWGGTPGKLPASELEMMLGAMPEWNDWLDNLKPTSLRSRHKLLRVALTLAAWDGKTGPSQANFWEASCYRPERYGLCD